MNLQRLEQVVEDLRDDLGNALVATDIWATDDGTSLAGFNPQPKRPPCSMRSRVI